MEMYKRIAAIVTKDDREDIEEELLDRFGETPAVVDTLLDIAQLRAQANRLGVSQVLFRSGVLMMKLDEHCTPDPRLLLQAMVETDRRLSLSAAKPAALLLKDGRLAERDMLREGLKVLLALNARLDALRPGASPLDPT
jgi:transcription-repair coupling factor (superfamily II helicase)